MDGLVGFKTSVLTHRVPWNLGGLAERSPPYWSPVFFKGSLLDKTLPCQSTSTSTDRLETQSNSCGLQYGSCQSSMQKLWTPPAVRNPCHATLPSQLPTNGPRLLSIKINKQPYNYVHDQRLVLGSTVYFLMKLWKLGTPSNLVERSHLLTCLVKRSGN
jgi:hypothetical protein